MKGTRHFCCSAVRGGECHCALCHQTFASLALFDLHQDVSYRRRKPVKCRAPQELKLVQNDRGTWCTPKGLEARKLCAERVARVRSARRRGRV